MTTMTTVKHLDHLNLSVTDLETTSAWYRRVFGFEIVEDGESGGVRYRILRAGEAMLCVYEHSHRRSPQEVEETLHRVNHFGLRITDPGAWQRTVEREALEVNHGGLVRFGHSTSWYVFDPSGHEIEVACWDGDRVAFDPIPGGGSAA